MIITSSCAFFKRYSVCSKRIHMFIPLSKKCSLNEWVGGLIGRSLSSLSFVCSPWCVAQIPAHRPVIYTHVGFMPEDKFFVIRKLLESRKRISFPVHLVINLPKSSRQIKFPYLRALRHPRGRWECFCGVVFTFWFVINSESKPGRVYLVHLLLIL